MNRKSKLPEELLHALGAIIWGFLVIISVTYSGTTLGCRALGGVFIFLGIYGAFTHNIPIYGIRGQPPLYYITGFYAVSIGLLSCAVGIACILYPAEVMALWGHLFQAATPPRRPLTSTVSRLAPGMAYQVVFDIASAGYKSWTFPARGLIFIAAGVILVRNRKVLPGWQNSPRASTALASLFLGGAVLWTAVSFYTTYRDYRCLVSAIASGSAKVAEGPVTNFKPMPLNGHGTERFCVQGACFEYSDYLITAGFNNTSSHGGPIREGLQIRVTYVGNSIAKLEVRE